MGILDNETIEIACPECGRKVKKTIGWLRRNRKAEIPCTGCDKTLVLDSSDLDRDIREMERSLTRMFK